MFYQVKDNPDLIRDSSNKAIINKNKQALENSRLARQKRLGQQKQIDKLDTELKEVKQMLTLILEKLGNK